MVRNLKCQVKVLNFTNPDVYFYTHTPKNTDVGTLQHATPAETPETHGCCMRLRMSEVIVNRSSISDSSLSRRK